LKGKTISNYRVLDKIGSGGMGEVYKALDTKLKRPIVLKFLPVELTSNPEFRERFEREAQAAAALNHPNIITIYEINQFEGRLYIAMEFIEGETLKDITIRNSKLKTDCRGEVTSPIHMKKKESKVTLPLHMDRIINIAIQICEGLDEAHKRGVIHRDIKPQNIIIDSEERIKILDFGLAKLEGVTGLTKEFYTLGTLNYMSPEQINGEELDQRSDIWSLGVVLFELIAQELPFGGDTPQATIHSILNKEPESLVNLSSNIPENMARVIKKALEKNIFKRYKSAEEMKIDLQSLVNKDDIRVPERLESKIKNSIAVLAFTDMSPKRDQEYFCDGIAEELINRLTGIEGLKVASRTSSFYFKGKDVDIFGIGQRLRVDTLLEGSVRKIKNRLRISIQLVDVTDGYYLWSERYDREQKDIFAIQEEITTAIVENLKVKLLGEEKEKSRKRYTENPEAYLLYLKGRYFWNRRYEGGLKTSIEFFQQAIEKDPLYSLPYVGIADSLNILGFYGFLPPHEAFKKAKASAIKALEIDDKLGEAYSSLGWITTFYDWNWQEAEANYLRAIELNPKYATAHVWYAMHLIALGREKESIAKARYALELDPLSLIINSMLGVILILARRYDEATEQLIKTLEMDPNFLLARIWMGETYLFKGYYQEAIVEFQKAITVSSDMTYALSDLGCAYASAGQKEEALKIIARFNEMAKSTYVSNVQIAQVYVRLGMKDKVFSHFEQALQDRDSFMVWLKMAPHLDRVRSDKRFNDFLKKVGLNH
jgi:serine/threonine protein kinase/Tfp pilus assembly protein PilF